jgi:MSHA pilin protein MshD
MVKQMSRSQHGFSLIEIVIFLIISSIALVGVLKVYQLSVSSSADGLTSKIAIEAAYALLEEVEAMPFTFCDTSDPSLVTATSPASCALPQGLTPAAGKSRGGASPFSNVGDFGGYTQLGIRDLNGNAILGLENHRISVRLSQPSVGGVSSSNVIKIEVEIAGPYSTHSIFGYKFRHSPNATP